MLAGGKPARFAAPPKINIRKALFRGAVMVAGFADFASFSRHYRSFQPNAEAFAAQFSLHLAKAADADNRKRRHRERDMIPAIRAQTVGALARRKSAFALTAKRGFCKHFVIRGNLPSQKLRNSQPVHFNIAELPRRHCLAGIRRNKKGLCCQPKDAFAAAASSAPSGAPCAAALPCLFGAPLPIIVRQAISVGRLSPDFALRGAVVAGYAPSQLSARQP